MFMLRMPSTLLTHYKQLLLYISYDKSNFYMFITSKCFLVPITMALNLKMDTGLKLFRKSQQMHCIEYSIAPNYKSQLHAFMCDSV